MTTSQPILDKQRNLLRKADSHLIRQVCSLAEVNEVLEGESKGDGFGEGNRDVAFGFVDIGVWADGNGAGTDIALAGEFDAFLCSFDDDWRKLVGRMSTPP